MRSILEITGRTDIEVHDIPTQIRNQDPLLQQIVALADACPLSRMRWQSEEIVVNPPGYAPVAAALLAELHGRMGHFPTLIRMRPITGSTPTVFEVAEILNLQTIREAARERR